MAPGGLSPLTFVHEMFTRGSPMSKANTGRFRFAEEQDGKAVLDLLARLNVHELEPVPDPDTRQRLLQHGFGSSPQFEVIGAESAAGVIVGCALYVRTYCSLEAYSVLLLDAMYVLPECRSTHVGSGLFYCLARTAVDRGWGRVEWSVLGFNKVAVEFYERVGASPIYEWDSNAERDFRVYRLDGESLKIAAGKALGSPGKAAWGG